MRHDLGSVDPLDDHLDRTRVEIAAWHYAHRDELDAEGDELADFEVSSQLSMTLSFRLPGVEADSIRAEADRAGISVSEWIRQACAAAVEDDEGAARQRELETSLAETEKQLGSIQKRLAAARKTSQRRIPVSQGSARRISSK